MRQGTPRRAIALFVSVILLITLMMPSAAMAANIDRYDYTVTAWAGSDEQRQEIRSGGRVAVGTTVTMGVSGYDGDIFCYVDDQCLSCVSISEERGTVRVTILSAPDREDSVLPCTIQVTDEVRLSFSFTVVDQLVSATSVPIEVEAGQQTTLRAAWPEGTVATGNYTYTWTAAQNAPQLASGSDQSLSRELRVPADTPPGTYEYRVTPRWVDYELQPLLIPVTVRANAEEPSQAPTPSGEPSASQRPVPPPAFFGWADAVVWYAGLETLPVLTAEFSENLTHAVWTGPAPSAEEVASSDPEGSTATYTVPGEVAVIWNPGDRINYTCVGTNSSGATASVNVQIIVLEGAAPQVQGIVSLNGKVYEKSYLNTPCEADALSANPPALTVLAAGGTPAVNSGDSAVRAGMVRAEQRYRYVWYAADDKYNTTGEPLQGGELNEDGTRCTMQLSRSQLATSSGTAYFVCIVSPSEGESRAAEMEQGFAIRTVPYPQPQADTNGDPDDEPAQEEEIFLTPGEDIDDETPLTIRWNPPVTPTDVTEYIWRLEEAPDGGEVIVDTGTRVTLRLGERTSSGTRPYILLIRVSRPGQYRISCLPSTGQGSSRYRSVVFHITGTGRILQSGLVMQSGSSGVNGVLGSPVPIVNNTVRMGVNGRFSLYVPSRYINSSRRVTYQWLMRRSSSSAPEPVPRNMGFYGVRSQTLISGPLTALMNGWQFSLRVAYADEPDVYEQTDWVTVNVSDSSAAAPLSIGTMSSPSADASNNIRITRGGTVTLEAFAGSSGTAAAQNVSYQWYTQAAGGQAQAIAGAIYATYVISNVTAEQNGQQYWCVIYYNSSPNNTQTSTRYTLSVNTSPAAVLITEPSAPQLKDLPAGQQMTLTVEASTLETGQVTYQWYVRKSETPVSAQHAILSSYQARQFLGAAAAAPVSGAVSQSCTVSSLTSGVYEYFCRVTSASDTSQSADCASYYIIVLQADTTPIVLEPAQPITYIGGIGGNTLVLPCVAYSPNSDTPTYQWQTGTSAAGPWTDMEQSTSSELRLLALSDQNANQYYRCAVTNPGTGETVYSNVYMVTVWNFANTPSVSENPQSIEYVIVTGSDGTAPGNTIQLTSSASILNSAYELFAQWQYRPTDGEWINVPSTQFGTTIGSPVTVDGKSTLTLDANAASYAPSGEYRCVWTAGRQQPNAPLVPQSESLPARVLIVYPGLPRIITQPTGAVVQIGESAMYTVEARLDLSTETDDELVYIWQMSQDRGVTWQNCTSEQDGTGQFTATFTTYPVTAAMYQQLAAASPGNLQDSIYRYRCIVANRRLSDAVLSIEAPLVILPGDTQPTTPTAVIPRIIAGPGSSLLVAGSGSTRYLTGVTATAAGVTVEIMLRELRYEPPLGYFVRVVSTTGTQVQPTAVLCTGMQIELVNAATNQVVDSAQTVVKGDVLGNGKLTLSQIVRLARAYSDEQPLDGPYKLAGMTVGEGGTITLTDLVGVADLYKDSRKQSAR